jgi:hypothetical protein
MPEMCGATFEEAMRYLEELERATRPASALRPALGNPPPDSP